MSNGVYMFPLIDMGSMLAYSNFNDIHIMYMLVHQHICVSVLDREHDKKKFAYEPKCQHKIWFGIFENGENWNMYA